MEIAAMFVIAIAGGIGWLAFNRPGAHFRLFKATFRGAIYWVQMAGMGAATLLATRLEPSQAYRHRLELAFWITGAGALLYIAWSLGLGLLAESDGSEDKPDNGTPDK